jgi:hypothetical protein
VACGGRHKKGPMCQHRASTTQDTSSRHDKLRTGRRRSQVPPITQPGPARKEKFPDCNVGRPPGVGRMASHRGRSCRSKSRSKAAPLSLDGEEGRWGSGPRRTDYDCRKFHLGPLYSVQSFNGMEQGHRWVSVMTRIRFKRKAALKARLDLEAQQLRDEAKSCPPGHKRDSLLRKARQNEITSNITEWLTSPGLKPPK